MNNKLEVAFDIMRTMNTIEYGFQDKEGFNIMNDSKKWDEEFNKFYFLLSPEELLQRRCGVCWDQVELERELFEKKNISVETYFIYIDNKKELPSHTFLVFEVLGNYYWFEHAWQDYLGIHEYQSLNDLLCDVKKKFINSYDVVSDYFGSVFLYKYKRPKFHITCNQFYDYLKTQKLIKI